MRPGGSQSGPPEPRSLSVRSSVAWFGGWCTAASVSPGGAGGLERDERVAERARAVAGHEIDRLADADQPGAPLPDPGVPAIGAGAEDGHLGQIGGAVADDPAAVRDAVRAVAIAGQAAEGDVDDAALEQQRRAVALAVGVERDAWPRARRRRVATGAIRTGGAAIAEVGRQIERVQVVLVVVGVARDGVQRARRGVDDRRAGDADPLRRRLAADRRVDPAARLQLSRGERLVAGSTLSSSRSKA